MAKEIDIGAYSAYAIAVEHGYEGTEEEFAMQLTDSAANGALAQDGAERTEAALEELQIAMGSIPEEYGELSARAVRNSKSIEQVNGVKQIIFESGYFDLKEHGTVIDITQRSPSSTGMVSGVAECTPGETISVNIRGAGSSSGGARAFAFLDETKAVISRSATNVSKENEVLIAPENAAYILLNTQSVDFDYYAYVGKLTKDQTAEIDFCVKLTRPEETLQSVTSDVDELFTPGMYRVPTTEMASEIANLPDSRGGLFYVVVGTQADYIRQFYITNNLESFTYVRYYAGETYGWGQWYKYTTDDDLEIYVTQGEFDALKAQIDRDFTWLSNYKYIGHLFIDTIAQDVEAVIPSESVYEVECTKRLGFHFIEGHIQPTATPGKYVVMHGVSGKLGYELVKVYDGSYDPETRIDSLTFDEIRSNYIYRSKYSKYQTAVASAEEWLTACKKHGLIPMVRCDDETAIEVVRKHVGNDFILYNGTREQHRGVLMHYQNQLGETLEESKAAVNTMINNYGLPFIICTFTIDHLTADELAELVQYTHEKGAYFMTANCYYNNSLWRIPKVANAGGDFASSGWEVEPFESGNICNFSGGVTFSDFVTNGSVNGGVLSLNAGQTVSIPGQNSQFLAKGSLYVKYNGKIKVQMGNYWKGATAITSNGEGNYYSTYFLEQAPTFTITATEQTQIHELVYKASKC